MINISFRRKTGYPEDKRCLFACKLLSQRKVPGFILYPGRKFQWNLQVVLFGYVWWICSRKPLIPYIWYENIEAEKKLFGRNR